MSLPSEPSTRGPVLVIDDDTDLREVVQYALASRGYETVDAPDGQTALSYLRSHPTPPLVLLDWNMAPMNGPEFMAEVGKDDALAGVPVVLLTADAGAAAEEKGFSFAGFLTKPVTLDALLEIVSRYCGPRH